MLHVRNVVVIVLSVLLTPWINMALADGGEPVSALASSWIVDARPNTSTNLKPAHNSGSNAPPPFIDDLFDVSDRSVMPMVVQKKHLIEQETGDDKGARARQAFRGAGFEGTGLDDALEEQLDGFAPIGIEVTFPRVRIRRQLLGGEQPAAVLRIGGHEVGPAKRRVAQ